MIAGNICSFFAACFTLLSAWSRDRKRIYLYQAAQCLILAVANIFFVSVSGTTTYFLCAVRNWLIAENRFTGRRCILFVIAVAVLGLAANTRGIVGLLPVITTVIYTVACLYVKRTQDIKWNIIVNLVLWTVYDLLIGDYVSAGVDSVSAGTALLSVFHEKRERR